MTARLFYLTSLSPVCRFYPSSCYHGAGRALDFAVGGFVFSWYLRKIEANQEGQGLQERSCTSRVVLDLIASYVNSSRRNTKVVIR